MNIVERRKLYDNLSIENVREIFICYKNKAFSIIVHSHDSRRHTRNHVIRI